VLATEGGIERAIRVCYKHGEVELLEFQDRSADRNPLTKGAMEEKNMVLVQGKLEEGPSATTQVVARPEIPGEQVLDLGDPFDDLDSLAKGVEVTPPMGERKMDAPPAADDLFADMAWEDKVRPPVQPAAAKARPAEEPGRKSLAGAAAERSFDMDIDVDFSSETTAAGEAMVTAAPAISPVEKAKPPEAKLAPPASPKPAEARTVVVSRAALDARLTSSDKELSKEELALLEQIESPNAVAEEPQVMKPSQLVSAVIRLLLRKGIFSDTEFLEELKRR
jgi:hypothetical protein